MFDGSPFQYPEGIRKMEFRPEFAIRGLHYDIEKGLLLKLDSFLQIQLGSVYRGLTPLRYTFLSDYFESLRLECSEHLLNTNRPFLQ